MWASLLYGPATPPAGEDPQSVSDWNQMRPDPGTRTSNKTHPDVRSWSDKSRSTMGADRVILNTLLCSVQSLGRSIEHVLNNARAI
jgi:hypothetical protein